MLGILYYCFHILLRCTLLGTDLLSQPDQPGNRGQAPVPACGMRRKSDSTAAGETDQSRTELFLFGLFPALAILLLLRIGLSSQLVEGLIQGGIF